MKNMKVPNVLGGAGISVLLKLGIVGGIGLYAAANNLYNVEGAIYLLSQFVITYKFLDIV
ncbi:hypothetical protein JHK84_055631 [Glycine max]|nr:hypothetical protein JHK85_056595 [Glycine max]KAG5074400.1 hypothetical protein JHK84_055631 [Glycine max]